MVKSLSNDSEKHLQHKSINSIDSNITTTIHSFYHDQQNASMWKDSLMTIKEKISSALETLESNMLFTDSIQKKQSVYEQLSPQITESFISPFQSKNSVKNQSSNNNAYNLITHRVYSFRHSRISELLHVRDIQTVYNIFVAIFLVMGCTMILHNFIDTGQFLDLSILIWAFGNIQLAIISWILMFSWTIFSAFILKYLFISITSYISIILYIISQTALFLFSTIIVLHNQVPIATASIIMIEQTRMSLKLHAYIRTIIGCIRNDALYLRQIQPERISEQTQLKGDPFSISRFLYFFFCPVLLYRYEYPRTKVIRFSRVLHHFMESIFCVLYIYTVFLRFCLPSFHAYHNDPLSHVPSRAILHWLSLCFPSTVCFLLLFFCVLHCWLNAWAELLKFGDRQFYSDWWNCDSFADYYRKWNGVVHDWIRLYLYTDILRVLNFIFSKNHNCNQTTKSHRIIASIIVFEISAVIHELILACAFGFCFPVLMIMFGGPGVIFSYLTFGKKYHRTLNVFMWSMLFIGIGLNLTLYSEEYFARKTMEQHLNSVGESIMCRYGWKGFFMPMSLFSERN